MQWFGMMIVEYIQLYWEPFFIDIYLTKSDFTLNFNHEVNKKYFTLILFKESLVVFKIKNTFKLLFVTTNWDFGGALNSSRSFIDYMNRVHLSLLVKSTLINYKIKLIIYVKL